MYELGNWVDIISGEFKSSYGKIAALNIDGTYKVLPYNTAHEPQKMIDLSESAFKLIPPLEFSEKDLEDLAKAEKTYADYAQHIFPPFNVKASGVRKLTSADISDALSNINKTNEPLGKFKEWFWVIQNVFYDAMEIKDRYDEKMFSDSPKTEDELFSTVFSLTEKLYWRLEERFVIKENAEKFLIKFDSEPDWNSKFVMGSGLEETAYRAVVEDIQSRVRTFESNIDLPEEEWNYSISQKRHIISSYEKREDLKNAPEDELKRYKKFVQDLYEIGDINAMKILAWEHYEGGIYQQDFALAEKYLLELFNKTGDPAAANSLGYIYYYGRTNGGEPEYEKAFHYFSFGSLAGIDESIYKSGDMLIHGKGTVRNIDMGLNLLVDGYKDTLTRFCEGEYDNKFADYALRMGNVCRENLVYGMGIRDAYKFYLEAQYAIKKRMETGDFFGDKSVAKKINYAVRSVKKEWGDSIERSELKADFPIYISHFFEQKFPVRVTLEKKNDNYYLRLHTYHVMPGCEAKILISFPEMSYVDLTSEISFRLEGVSFVKMPEKESGNTFLSDGFNKNDVTGALEFYAGKDCVAAVAAKWFVIEIKRNDDNSKN